MSSQGEKHQQSVTPQTSQKTPANSADVQPPELDDLHVPIGEPGGNVDHTGSVQPPPSS
jgi:hypothetical protein